MEGRNLPVNIGSRNSFVHGHAKAHDHPLTGIDRNKRMTQVVVFVRFRQDYGTNLRKLINAPLDCFFDRRGQRYREAIKMLRQEGFANLLRNISTPVPNRQDTNTRKIVEIPCLEVNGLTCVRK